MADFDTHHDPSPGHEPVGRPEALQHRAAWDLIPWVVNGSARPADIERVGHHALQCAECAEELEFHRQVMAGMADADGGASGVAAHGQSHGWVGDGADIEAARTSRSDASAAGATDRALAAMWSRIDATEPLVPSFAQATAEDTARAAANDAPPTPTPSTRSRNPPALRWLAAAAVVQAIGLAAMAGALWERQPTAYRTLSEAATPSAARIRLVASPQMTLADLQALLARQRLHIVDSSADASRLGLAMSEAEPGVDAGSAAVDATVARLRNEPGVLLAEPIVQGR